jgi:hypothetical protein
VAKPKRAKKQAVKKAPSKGKASKQIRKLPVRRKAKEVSVKTEVKVEMSKL